MSLMDVESSLRKLCECPVCLEILNNPRTLQCEHSICKECLDNLVIFSGSFLSITCPTCQYQQNLENGVETLKGGLLIKQMLYIIPKNM